MSGPFQRIDAVKSGIDDVSGKEVKSFRGIKEVGGGGYSPGQVAGASYGGSGIVVPRTDSNGSVPGKGIYRGNVVHGHEITGSSDGSGEKVVSKIQIIETGATVQSVDEDGRLLEAARQTEADTEERKRAKKQKKKDKKKAKREFVTSDSEEESVDYTDELREFMQYEPPSELNEEEPLGSAENPHIHNRVIYKQALIPKTPPKKLRIRMKGDFGSYRGVYTHMEVHGALIVLVYELDESVYTPPVSDISFNISCGQESYAVYFAGIEFELDFLKQGIQIFFKAE